MTDGPALGASSVPDEPRRAEARPLGVDSRVLRARWRTASLAAGWRFPSDWGLPEVDAVCAAVLTEGPSDQVLSGLGRARAAAGAGLDETLADLAALHAVLVDPDAADGFVTPDIDATPSRLLRITAIAWAEVALDKLTNTEVTDPLTGLPTAAYLRTRLAELYRAAARAGRSVPGDYVLLRAAINLNDMAGWSRLTVMILTADALRKVFDGAETVACLGPSTLAVLTERDEQLPTRAVAVRREIIAQLYGDRQLRNVQPPSLGTVRLQPTYAESCAVLSTISRS